jgi:hypothetical protein
MHNEEWKNERSGWRGRERIEEWREDSEWLEEEANGSLWRMKERRTNKELKKRMKQRRKRRKDERREDSSGEKWRNKAMNENEQFIAPYWKTH